MLKALTFDFWGTLVDTQGGGSRLKARRLAILADHLGGYSSAELSAAYDVGWSRFTAGMELGLGVASVTVLAETLCALGAGLSPQRFGVVQRGWESAILSVPMDLLPGAADVLRWARKQRLFVGLISDTGVSPGWAMRQMLRQKGLLSLFDVLIFSDEVGVTKVKPLGFQMAMRAVSVRPCEAMHVGDTPATDIRGARAAGLSAALVLECSQRREAIREADLVLERLSELPTRLSEWL